MALPITFSTLSAGNQPLIDFDTMFSVVASMGQIMCTASGTNIIALTPIANMPTVNTYANYQAFGFIPANTPTGSVTINVSGVGALAAYAPDGATQLGSGSLLAGAYYEFIYNSALNSAAGGFQLTSPQTVTNSGTINSGTGGRLAYYASTGTAISGAPATNLSSGALSLGAAATTAGSLVLFGGTSGSCTIATPAVASTTTINLPNTNGSSGNFITTDGNGNWSWAAPSSSLPTALGVGSQILAIQTTGSTMAANATAPAANIVPVVTGLNGGASYLSLALTGDSITGTWKALQTTPNGGVFGGNIQGGSFAGLFLRVS